MTDEEFRTRLLSLFQELNFEVQSGVYSNPNIRRVTVNLGEDVLGTFDIDVEQCESKNNWFDL